MANTKLDEMILQAKMRASVLSNLDAKYSATSSDTLHSGNGKKRKEHPGSTSTSTTGLPISSPPHAQPLRNGGGESKEAMISHLQTLLNNQSEKIRSKLTDQLGGKSLVLESNKPQKSRASKIKSLMKSRQQVSNRELKRKKKLTSEQLLTSKIAPQVVHSLQLGWKEYAKAASKNCKSVSQIQSRMLSLNLVGASFLCLQKNDQQYFPSSSSVVEKDWGTIIAESNNCVFVAYPNALEEETVSEGDGVNSSDASLMKVQKYLKSASIFAFTSIDVVQSLSQNPSTAAAFPICIVHGKQHLPHLRQKHSSRMLSLT